MRSTLDLLGRVGIAIRERVHVRLPRGAVAASFLLLLVLLYFWPFLLRGEVIAPTDLLFAFSPWSSQAGSDFHVKNFLRSDIVDGYLPTLRAIKMEVLNGHLPLWTPLMAQGRPLASSLGTSFFHPLTLVFVTVFPMAEGFSLLVMSKLFLAGLFTYLFLRKWDVSRAGSVVGGMGYMFSGFNIVWLMWPVTLVSSFGPLLFLQTETLVRSPRLRNSALLAVVVAMMVLGGFPSVTGYFFYAAGLYFVVRLAQRFAGSHDWRGAVWTGGAFGLSFLIGVGITAVQLLPTLELTDFIDISYRRSLSAASLPFKQGIQLLFPNYYGNQVFGNYQGASNLNETSGYVGIVTMALALTGFGMGLLRRRVAVTFFGALALMAVLLIYGVGPFLGWVSHLPVFNLNPSTRLLSVFGFAAAVSAAFGFDEIRALRFGGRWRLAALSVAAVAAATLAAMVGYLIYEALQRRAILSAFVEDFPTMEFHTFRIVTVAFGLALLMLFVIMVFLHLRRPLPTLALASVVALLVSSDLLFFAYRQNPTVADAYFYPETPAIGFLQSNLEPYERMAPFDDTFLIPGPQLYYGLSSSFSHALHDDRQRNLILAFSDRAFATATALRPKSAVTRFDSPIVDLLGIRYLTFQPNFDLSEAQPESATRYRLVYSRAGELRIYENTDFAPAFLVSDVRVAAPSQILQGVSSAEFDPHSRAYVEEPPPPEWTAAQTAPSGSVSSVTVSRYESDVVIYDVETEGQALLATPELFFPGWTAYVDGERTEIYRTNYIFRGVFLSAGHHEVEFTYRPSSFRAGAIISFLSIGVVGAMLLAEWAWRVRRTRGHRLDE